MAGEQPVAGDERLVRCPEATVGLALPSPLNERLNQLVQVVESAGERTTRKEVVASLILSEAIDGASLSEEIRQLRRAVVHEAVAPDATGRVHLSAMVQDHEAGRVDRVLVRAGGRTPSTTG